MRDVGGKTREPPECFLEAVEKLAGEAGLAVPQPTQEERGRAQEQKTLLEVLEAAAGLIIFSVALVILELKRIELADYLPALIVAPLFAWLWR